MMNVGICYIITGTDESLEILWSKQDVPLYIILMRQKKPLIAMGIKAKLFNISLEDYNGWALNVSGKMFLEKINGNLFIGRRNNRVSKKKWINSSGQIGALIRHVKMRFFSRLESPEKDLNTYEKFSIL